MVATNLWRGFSRAPWPLLFSLSLVGTWVSMLDGAHAHIQDICGSMGGYWLGLTRQEAQDAMVSWALMLLAMMPPLLAMPLVYAWHVSLPRRRRLAVTVFAAGYAIVWMAAGPAIIAAAGLVQWLVGESAWIAAVALALIWSSSPWQFLAHNRSHRLPLIRLFGWPATRDLFIFGLTHGMWCLSLCWAWMLVPLLVNSWHVPAMMFVGLMMLFERLALSPRRPAWHLPVFLFPVGGALHG